MTTTKKQKSLRAPTSQLLHFQPTPSHRKNLEAPDQGRPPQFDTRCWGQPGIWCRKDNQTSWLVQSRWFQLSGVFFQNQKNQNKWRSSFFLLSAFDETTWNRFVCFVASFGVNLSTNPHFTLTDTADGLPGFTGISHFQPYPSTMRFPSTEHQRSHST